MTEGANLNRLDADSTQVSDVEMVLVEASPLEIYERLRHDFDFFITFFLGEQLELDIPDLHRDAWAIMVDPDPTKERVTLAIPRDHAKTTLAKLCVVWYWLFSSTQFALYGSNTSTIAGGACSDIIGFVTCDNFVRVFGSPTWLKRRENELLWQFRVAIPGRHQPKMCILRGLGVNQQMRGINLGNMRPQLAVCDDMEDKDDVKSPIRQKALDEWVFGTFIKALARKKKILWLGNMLASTSLLARLCKRPNWNPVVFGAIVKDTRTGTLRPLWPDRWTMKALIEDFHEYRDMGLIEVWMCEMMNMPGNADNGFDSRHLNYVACPAPDDVVAAWLTIDPAFSQQSYSDSSCIAVNVIRNDGLPMTAMTSHGKWTEMDLYNEAKRLAVLWGAGVWAIESIAAQRLLIPIFRMLSAQEGGEYSFEFVPIISGGQAAKGSRIRAYANMMAGGRWGLVDTDVHVTTQLLGYDMTKTDQVDDIVDAAAYGPISLESYETLIHEAVMQRDNKQQVKPRLGMADV